MARACTHVHIGTSTHICTCILEEKNQPLSEEGQDQKEVPTFLRSEPDLRVSDRTEEQHQSPGDLGTEQGSSQEAQGDNSQEAISNNQGS